MKPMNQTADDRMGKTLTILNDQSKLGKRVALLLAYLSEHGGKTRKHLRSTLPSGLLGEFQVSMRNAYIQFTDDRKKTVEITTRGREIILWLIGTMSKPDHWKTWEDAARLKQFAVPDEPKTRRIKRN
jgi:DNA-binding MarR family transcriptional regulator